MSSGGPGSSIQKREPKAGARFAFFQLISSAPYLPRFRVFCESALPALDFEALLVLPSRSVRDAAFAAFFDVTFPRLRCESALPAAALELRPVDLLLSVFDALDPARLLVSLAIWVSVVGCAIHPSNSQTFAARSPALAEAAHVALHASFGELELR